VRDQYRTPYEWDFGFVLHLIVNEMARRVERQPSLRHIRERCEGAMQNQQASCVSGCQLNGDCSTHGLADQNDLTNGNVLLLN